MATAVNRLAQLQDFCFKIGILSSHTGRNNTCINGISDNNELKERQKPTMGPYGYLLISQIKNEWLKANLHKFENKFLIDSANFLDLDDHSFYFNSILGSYCLKELPLGIVNTYNSVPTQLNQKNSLGFFNNQSTNNVLSCYHFYDKETTQSSLIDHLTFWQRERKNWWIRIFNNPENFQIDQLKMKPIECAEINEINLTYNLESFNSVTSANASNDSDVSINSNNNVNWLENIQHVTNLNENKRFFEDFFKGKIKDNLFVKDTDELIITRTSCESVLENILVDSLDFSDKNKPIFNLDFRLAPFKAAILIQTNNNPAKNTFSLANNLNSTLIKKNLHLNDNLSLIASDLRKMLFVNHINVMVMTFSNENELESKYEHLDRMGIPYTVFLPSSITKDGLCFIRNRDTHISEKTHINLIVKYFTAISNSLSF